MFLVCFFFLFCFVFGCFFCCCFAVFATTTFSLASRANLPVMWRVWSPGADSKHWGCWLSARTDSHRDARQLLPERPGAWLCHDLTLECTLPAYVICLSGVSSSPFLSHISHSRLMLLLPSFGKTNPFFSTFNLLSTNGDWNLAIVNGRISWFWELKSVCTHWKE